MKNVIIGLAIVAGTLAACSGDSNKETAKQDHAKYDTIMASKLQAATSNTGTFPGKEVVVAYVQLKNALSKDNGKDAATAGNAIVAALTKVDTKNLSKQQEKDYMDLAGDMKENAEHIGANAGKIDHQREHFEMLSNDMVDFIKDFGNGGQILYKDYCPMAGSGKGAIWISEVKEIKNPYLGSKMPTCGSIKDSIH